MSSTCPLPSRRLLALSFAALATAPLGASDVLRDETFAAGERTTQNLPSTAGWYGVTDTLSQAGAGAIELSHTGTSGHVFAHFTNAAARTLALNETITASFDFQLTKANDHEKVLVCVPIG